MQIFRVTFSQIISILVSVSFYCDHLSVSFQILSNFSLSISFTETIISV